MENSNTLGGLLSQEVYRATKDLYNYCEPPANAQVTGVNSDGTVNIQIKGINLPGENVPSLESDLVVGDNVYVVFVMGHAANHVVFGKVGG